MVDAYSRRDALLLTMGFSSYQKYLDSGVWSVIRARAFDVNGRVCVCCAGVAGVLHHDNYSREVLVGNNIRPLVPLCRPCHELIEFYPDGRKRDFKAVQRELSSRRTVKVRPNKKKRKKRGRPEIGLIHKAKHIARKRRQGIY